MSFFYANLYFCMRTILGIAIRFMYSALLILLQKSLVKSYYSCRGAIAK